MKRTILMIVIMIVCIGIESVMAETLEIPGTGASEVILKELALAFNGKYPGQEVLISRSIGSKSAIEMVVTDKTTMARVARPLEGDETKHGLKYLVFAKDAVVFAVSDKVGIQSLTPSQLVDIFSGKIENWEQVGKNKGPIRVLIRQAGDSSLRIIQEQMRPFQQLKFPDRAKILYHDYEMVDALEKFKLAIGWGTLSSFFPSKTINPIAIDQIMPAPENILSGKYIMTCNCALVFNGNRLNESGKRFIDFIFSDPAKQIIRKQGTRPVDRR
jgi:phosphate transport system substrate-binding protein